jgi:hypothetical protein
VMVFSSSSALVAEGGVADGVLFSSPFCLLGLLLVVGIYSRGCILQLSISLETSGDIKEEKLYKL